ncbi:hypothetical protein EYC80_002464 [Monilinia laxa]|uniref:Transmembrane protein n=1 Tax=Monilinia laxa TaxID=61186 RepID=A0A5N6K3X9_MONLA|nr:hypothetical protein EYC80_002464 [Monilinia laxa]
MVGNGHIHSLYILSWGLRKTRVGGIGECDHAGYIWIMLIPVWFGYALGRYYWYCGWKVHMMNEPWLYVNCGFML